MESKPPNNWRILSFEIVDFVGDSFELVTVHGLFSKHVVTVQILLSQFFSVLDKPLSGFSTENEIGTLTLKTDMENTIMNSF